jgi:hypothetical protein
MISEPSSELSSELSSGERLLWSGRPPQGMMLRKSDVFMIPFSLMWGGFAIFWELMVLSHLRGNGGGDSQTVVRFVFPLFGLPFVLIGLYIIFGRFFVDKKLREKTFYGVTNQRIIIKSGLFTRSTKSLNLRTLSDLSLTEKPDGSGTISFGPVVPFSSWSGAGSSSWPNSRRYSPPCFDTVPEAKRVYEIIRDAQKET